MRDALKCILILCSMIVAFGAAHGANKIIIEKADGSPGSELEVKVSLSNTDPISAVQITFPIPAESGITVPEGSATAIGRASAHGASAGIRDGVASLMLYSLSMGEIAAGDGEVMTFRIRFGNKPVAIGFTPEVRAFDINGNPVECSADASSITTVAPQIAFGSTSVDFGRVPIKSVYTNGLRIDNTGTAPLVVSGLQFSNSDFASSVALPLTVEPGGSKIVAVEYSPVKRGAVAATVTVECNSHDTWNTVGLAAEPYAVNELRVGDVFGNSDTEVAIPLLLKNMDGINGFTVAIPLPEQLKYVDGSFALSERRTDHAVSATFADGVLHATAYSMTNAAFSGNDGMVASFRVRLDGRESTSVEASTAVLSAIVDGEILNVISAKYPGNVSIRYPLINVNRDLSLGRTPITQDAVAEATVSNYGNAMLRLERAVLDSEYLRLDSDFPMEIEPGSSATVKVVCEGTYEGRVGGTLRIYSNDPDQRLVNIALDGLRYAPNSLAFENVSVTPDKGPALVDVSLSNYDAISGLQFDVEYPSDVFTPEDDFAYSERTTGYTMTHRSISPGVERYFCYSLGGGEIVPGDGFVFTLPFGFDSSVKLGSYPFTVKNIMLGTPELEDKNSAINDMGFEIEVVESLSSVNQSVADSEVIVTSEAHGIKIAGSKDGDRIAVYDSNGVIVKALLCDGSGTMRIGLPRGFYIVVVNGKAVKVLVP